MILEPPKLSDDIRKHLYSEHYRNRPIKSNYPDFEACFVMLHPFLSIKKGHENQISFETGTWPNKKQIIEHCDKLSWTDFINISGIRDYKSLDRAVAFYHRAFSIGERSEYLKLRKTIEVDRIEIIPPQVDNLPEIIENDILLHLKNIGYKELYFYSDIFEKNELTSIDEQVSNPQGLMDHIRIATPDNKILIVQDFDQRFSYIFGNEEFVEDIVKKLDLEGFYSTSETPESWSSEVISEKEMITWEEDMKLII